MNLHTALKETIGDFIVDQTFDRGELTIEVEAKHWFEVAKRLESSDATRFEQLRRHLRCRLPRVWSRRMGGRGNGLLYRLQPWCRAEHEWLA